MISDIVSRYRSRGLYGPVLKAALVRHAKVLVACDPGDAAELLIRARAMPKTKAQRRWKKRAIATKPSPVPLPTVDEARARWMAYDRKAGL